VRSDWRVYKEKPGDKVWWVDNGENTGDFLFTFDKRKVFNLFRDYPHELSPQEWVDFNAENEYWADYFSERNLMYEAEHHKEIEDIKSGR